MADATQDLEQRIRERAYLLWEMEGKPDGESGRILASCP